jgi:hypothetical protein
MEIIKTQHPGIQYGMALRFPPHCNDVSKIPHRKRIVFVTWDTKIRSIECLIASSACLWALP